jgi:hypothetical protein
MAPSVHHLPSQRIHTVDALLAGLQRRLTRSSHLPLVVIACRDEGAAARAVFLSSGKLKHELWSILEWAAEEFGNEQVMNAWNGA